MLKIRVIDMKKEDIKSITIAAIIAIAALEGIALLMGVNGILLTGVVAVLAGLGGLAIPTPKVFK